MGRPINKKFFANLNSPYNNFATGGLTGQGGESVATVTLGTGTKYSSTATATVSNPELQGGTAATVTLSISTVTGNIQSVTLVSGGSGYIAVPTITVAPATTGTTATFTVTLTDTRDSGLSVYAYLPSGSSAVVSDIMKQEASRRYLVRNAQGQGVCKLVAVATGSLVAGQMNLTATDSAGGTYYVTKLTARKALLTPITGTQFASGTQAGWSLTTAIANVSVVIANA